ncbi:MAG: DUF1150 family protein [Acetobacteraceae bacterium]
MNTNTNDNSEPAGAMVRFDIRHLSEAQLAQLGVQQIAYIRPVVVNGESGYSIHAADGTPMALAGDRDVAIAAVLQHEMLPALVH